MERDRAGQAEDIGQTENRTGRRRMERNHKPT